MNLRILIMLAGLMLTSMPASAIRVYKWTDVDGNVHYSDSRPTPADNAVSTETTHVSADTNTMQAPPPAGGVPASSAARGATSGPSRGADSFSSNGGIGNAVSSGGSGFSGGGGSGGGGSGGGGSGGGGSAGGGSAGGSSGNGNSGSSSSSDNGAAGGGDTGGGSDTSGSPGQPKRRASGADTGSGLPDISFDNPAADNPAPANGAGSVANAAGASGAAAAPVGGNAEGPGDDGTEVIDLPPAPPPPPVLSGPKGLGSVTHPLNCGDHPEALVCYKFTDDTSVQNVFIKHTDCVPDAIYDTNEKAARLGVGSECPADSSGQLLFRFPAVTTGQLWLTFRYKLEEGFIRDPRQFKLPANKVFAAWLGSSPCTGSSFIQGNLYYSGVIAANEACGSVPVQTKTTPELGSYNNQPGGDTLCAYAPPLERPPRRCMQYEEKWATYTYHFDLDGNEHGGVKTVDAWVQYEGEKAYQIFAWPLKAVKGFDHLYFSAYMTGKKNTIKHPVWKVWYQDLLITTKPLF